MSRKVIKRTALIVLFLSVAVFGTSDLSRLSEIGLKIEDSPKGFVVTKLKHPGISGVEPGDRLIAIGGTEIVNIWHAKWLMTDLLSTDPLVVTVKRHGETKSFVMLPSKTHHPLFILLNLLLGITFIIVGVMVGWGGKSDPVSRSYYRLTCVTGCSVLFFSPANAWQPLALQYFQSFGRIGAHTMISPLLVDFLLRFTGRPLARRASQTMYGAIILLSLYIMALYFQAERSFDPEAIARFEFMFTVIVGVIMGVAFVISLGAIIHGYASAKDPSLRHKLGWLVIVTSVGLLPYFACHRIPLSLGMAPILPEWTIFGLMLIVPIGWGMAVAAFRMLNVEWALSRTIIYAVAVMLASYVLLTLLLIVGKEFSPLQDLPLKSQILIGLLWLVISASGLSAPIRWVIDRLYYRDWFNEQEAIRQLGEELSKALVEEELERILTVRLPEILKVQHVALIHGEPDRLKLSSAAIEQNPERNKAILDYVRNSWDAREPEPGRRSSNGRDGAMTSLGFELLLPLRHGGNPVGALLIGRKLSGALFSEKDHILLNALSNHAASALANLSLTKQIIEQEKRALAVDMAGGIAHEINNSLAPLMGQAQLAEIRLRSGGVTGSVDILPSLDIMIQMSERIKRIASNLSRLSQPPKLEPELLSLDSVAEEALVIIRETAGRIKHFSESDPNARLKLQREINGGGTMIWGDRQQLGQIYLNLIVNSADALEERGSGTITVGVRKDDQRQGVVGYVADDGPGIPSELEDRIMQPYFTTKIKGKGTGLGLAIVKQIVELHLGTLRLVSSPGTGARFEFFLPAKPTSLSGQTPANLEPDI